jgi:hypothetical protein
MIQPHETFGTVMVVGQMFHVSNSACNRNLPGDKLQLIGAYSVANCESTVQ